MLRMVPGLGVLEHDSVRVECVAGDHGQAIVALQIQTGPVNIRGPFHGNAALAGDDLHSQRPLQVGIDGLLCEDPNVLCYRRYLGEQELLVICNLTGEDQTVTIDNQWKNDLLSNREHTAFDGKLLPYDCIVLTK